MSLGARAFAHPAVALVIGATFVLVVAIVCVVVALLIRRRSLKRRRRRAETLRERFERPVLEFVGTVGADPPPALTSVRRLDERAAIAEQLARFNTMLEGEARVRITGFLLEAGYVDQTIAELRSRRGWKRGEAALALGEFGASRSIPHLAMLMIRDPSLPVRLAAARALSRFDDYKAAAALLTVLPTDRVPRGVVAQALLELGDRGLRSVIDACDDDEADIREVACRVVGLVSVRLREHAQAATLEILHRRLDSDAVDAVRLAACRSLATLGTSESGRYVGRILHHPNPVLQAAACDSAAALQIHDLVPEIAGLLADYERDALQHDPLVARAAARALVALDANSLGNSRFVVEARAFTDGRTETGVAPQ